MTAYTDFHYSPTGSGVISGAQVLEQTEQGINGLGQYVQDNVSGAIDTANEALTTARNADSNATAAISLANSLNAQIIAANQTAGNALTTAQSAQNTANNAYSLATTANNNAATALNAANSASAGVTALTGTVNSLGNRMTAAENAINANAGNITTLQNNLATTNANVTAASNAASAAQATATSAQATATSAKNAAYVVRYTGTTITGGGTIAYADIDNTDNIKAGDKIIDISGAIYDIASVDTANQTVTIGASPVINLFCDAENLIPSANNSYDLGSSSYQWNNVYCSAIYSPAIINSNNAASPSDSSVSSIVALRNIITYTSGDPDATARINFRLMGTGEKALYPHETNQYSFGLPSRSWSNSYIQHGYFTGIQQGDEYSSNTRTNLTLTANRDSAGVSGILVDSFRSTTTQGQANHALGFEMKENSTRYAGCRMYWSYDSNAGKYNFALCPTKQGANQPASFSLGMAGFYWDKINECNPGALSLPVTILNNTYDISGDIIDLTGGNNAITAARTGWIFVKSDNATEISIENTTTGMGASDHSASATTLMVSIPVTSGETLNIIANCTSIDKAYLLPCQGNV